MSDSPLRFSDSELEEDHDFFTDLGSLQREETIVNTTKNSKTKKHRANKATVKSKGIEQEHITTVDPEGEENFSTVNIPSSYNPGGNTFVWGTTVCLTTTFQNFRRFLCEYEKEGTEDPYYLSVFRQMRVTETYFLNLDCSHLYSFDRALYNQLVNYPRDVLNVFDGAASDVFKEVNILEEMITIPVRPYNLNSMKPMRDLNPSDIDKLITIKGMIIRTSHIVPELLQAFFKCHSCHYEETSLVSLNFLKEPTVCKGCTAKNTMQYIHNRCVFADKQYIKLQETVESIPEGETPHTVTLRVHESLVDVSRPGDKVLVTGIYRAQPLRVNRSKRTTQQIFKTYIDALHFRKTSDKQLGVDDESNSRNSSSFFPDYDDTEELAMEYERRKQKVIELSKAPDIYDQLVRSFAPSIWSLEDVKKGILCQLFGGSSKQFNDKNTGKFRCEINTLLVGDPGTSKSQLLQYVNKIAPRGIYTSGKGSSAVGLTAYVTKDPDTGEAVLESGALVLSDKGVCCIDEFDKMNDQTRSILHEAMEQQTVSVAKAGIICSLNARTSIIASANPRESKYNPRLSVVENIQLPPTLLSRFDLIYLVLDKPNPDTDRKLAKHLVSLYFKQHPDNEDTMAIDVLTDYISYAKKNCNPEISDEAAAKLVEGYIQMRRLGPSQSAVGRKTISATPRQLESLVRLSEALAKMELSPLVLEKHVVEALRLMRVAIQDAATDHLTGQIDMDLISTGRSQRSRQSLKQLYDAVKDLISGWATSQIKTLQLYNTLLEQASMIISQGDFEEVIAQLKEEDYISVSGSSIRNQTITRMFS